MVMGTYAGVASFVYDNRSSHRREFCQGFIKQAQRGMIHSVGQKKEVLKEEDSWTF